MHAEVRAAGLYSKLRQRRRLQNPEAHVEGLLLRQALQPGALLVGQRTEPVLDLLEEIETLHDEVASLRKKLSHWEHS